MVGITRRKVYMYILSSWELTLKVGGPESVNKIMYKIRTSKKKHYKIRPPNQNPTVQNQDPHGTAWDQF